MDPVSYTHLEEQVPFYHIKKLWRPTNEARIR